MIALTEDAWLAPSNTCHAHLNASFVTVTFIQFTIQMCDFPWVGGSVPGASHMGTQELMKKLVVQILPLTYVAAPMRLLI
jgi:hypothetical protein